MLDATMRLLDFLWTSFLILSPMLLLGLFLAGLIHVLISRKAILKWLSDDSLSSVCTSAAVGVPVPLCSCSVVPVVAEMRKKGASRSSCVSFLITAPETGADSILVTHAFFGFVAAVVRPVVSFITAVVTGIFCIGLIRDDDDAARRGAGHDHPHDEGPCEHDHADDGHDHAHCDHGHDHRAHTPLLDSADDCYVSLAQLKRMLRNWLRSVTQRTARTVGGARFASWVKPDFYKPQADRLGSHAQGEDAAADPEADGLTLRKVARHVFRYGFVEVADDILFALLVGVALGGVLFLAIPDSLMANEYARWLSYPVMVIVGIPLYICASASTPIAAALVAKGLSPGAALIFLMTGPATNSGTIAIIVSQFGARFASIYVGGVIAVTTALGIAIDAAVIAWGLTLPVKLSGAESPAILVVEWLGAIILIGMIVWRFRRGALKSGYQELVSNVRPVFRRLMQAGERVAGYRPTIGGIPTGSLLKWSAVTLLAALFLSTGLTAVGPSSVAYSRLFGKVVARDVPPGLHYLGPWPFFKIDKWPVRQVKSLVNSTPYEFVTGDINLLSVTANIQYLVTDPYRYHYLIENPQQVLMGEFKEELREYVSVRGLDQLLNVQRASLEREVRDYLGMAGDPDRAVATVEVLKVNLLSIHPVEETMSAFREISSSQDDRERIITNAQKYLVSLVPKAHGNAAYEVAQASGEAFRNVTVATAESEAIQVVSDAARAAPDVLYNMLWREKLETALAGKEKIIVPNQRSLNQVALWKGTEGEVALPPPLQEHTR